MVVARKELIRDGEMGTYHVRGRVVRRAFLCGYDAFTNKNYDYRKTWIKHRLKYVAKQFAVEVGGYSLMSNHTHYILRIRPDIALKWSSEEVAKRWWDLYPKRRDSLGNPAEPKDYELDQILFDKDTGQEKGLLEVLRVRLMSISWFMKALNEYIARKANREDGCTGHFWEGRFKSTALLDQAAVLACMAYVDLNPIHAGIATTPEASDFTSAQERVQAKMGKEKLKFLRAKYEEKARKGNKVNELQNEIVKFNIQATGENWLSPLAKSPLDQPPTAIPPLLNMDLDDYLELLDWTGRQHRQDKKGQIPEELEAILKRLEIETESWLKTVKQFDSLFHRVAGKVRSIKKAAQACGGKWFAGLAGAKSAFN